MERRQRVAIFGATSAIAAEVARLYAGRGARLFLAGRDPAKLRALVDALGDAVADFLEVDLTEPDAAAFAVSTALEALRRLGRRGDRAGSARRSARQRA